MTRSEKDDKFKNDYESEKIGDAYLDPFQIEDDEEFESKSSKSKKALVRFQKTVLFDLLPAGDLDEKIINPKFYNSFNYALFSRDRAPEKMTLGIVSPHQGDGKSTVASNLAVSFALSMESSVLLVDLNFQNPKVHEIFPTVLSPGFLDSIAGPTIRVVPTKIRNLAVLPAGNIAGNALQGFRFGVRNVESNPKSLLSTIGLEQQVEFRNIILSLEEKFDLIIFDLPSGDESKALTMLTKQLNAVIIVIHAGKTKKEDIDNLMMQLNEEQVSGFVLNRTAKD